MDSRHFPDQQNSVVELSRKDSVFHLVMKDGRDNRFNPTMVKAIHSALDVVQDYALKGRTECALVTLAASDQKVWSNGLDVAYLFESGDSWFISDQYLKLLKRMLLFPVITVAGISGHAYAGGLLFALCHDYRVMRNDKGFLSLNEIDLPSSLHPGMAWVARSKLPPTTLHHLVFGPQRYDGVSAQKAGLVDVVVKIDAKTPSAAHGQLIDAAHQLGVKGAPKVARAGIIVQDLKRACYEDVCNKLDQRIQVDVRQFMKPKL